MYKHTCIHILEYYFNTSAGPGLTPDIMENLRQEGDKKYQAVRHKILDLMDGHHPVINQVAVPRYVLFH